MLFGKKKEKKAEEKPALLLRENVLTGCAPVSPEEAIRKAGERLVESGYVGPEYVEGMLEREKSFSTAIGNHLAIPHGTNEVKGHIRSSGMVVMTYPDGIPWNGDSVKLVIGLAAVGDEHLEMLGRIVEAVSTAEDTDALVATGSPEEILKKFQD